MISEDWRWNLAVGIFLASAASFALMEAKSSSLIPKSLFLWPLFVVLSGVVSFVEGISFYGFSVFAVFGVLLILCGVQAAWVNLRRLAPWPSGAIWLGLALAGLAFQTYPRFEQRLMGFLWVAVGLTKVLRERSPSLETGTPMWVLLLFIQAVLLASYR